MCSLFSNSKSINQVSRLITLIFCSRITVLLQKGHLISSSTSCSTVTMPLHSKCGLFIPLTLLKGLTTESNSLHSKYFSWIPLLTYSWQSVTNGTTFSSIDFSTWWLLITLAFIDLLRSLQERKQQNPKPTAHPKMLWATGRWSSKVRKQVCKTLCHLSTFQSSTPM